MVGRPLPIEETTARDSPVVTLQMRTPSKLIAVLALAPAAGAFALAPAAVAAPAPAMTVTVHPASGVSSSYFTLSTRPGGFARAGTLELQNHHRQPVTVRLDPVGALTASTLGSAYREAGPSVAGQASWIVLPQRSIVLGAHATAKVPIGVNTPGGTAAGDYLSGISVEALGQKGQTRVRGNIAISSIQRYAVGLLVKVPGPRHSLIQLTGATIAREPAGLTFYLHARNGGNAILQNVRGRLLVTRGRRKVVRTAIGPGTFVTGTSIAYPLLAPREQPSEGAEYRVRAVMRYAGRVVRLDTRVRFGHKSAQTQQDFGGPPVRDPAARDNARWALLAGAIAVFVSLAGLGLALLRRRRLPGPRAALRALDRALAAARASREPLSLVRVADMTDKPRMRKLAKVVRPGIRAADRLYRLSGSELLIVAPDTRAEAARAVGSEIDRHLATGTVQVSVLEAGGRQRDEILSRLRDPRRELEDIELSADNLMAPR
jgi:hypothetical protein